MAKIKFSQIRDELNRKHGTNFRSLAEVKKAGFRVVRSRNGEFFLAKEDELEPLLIPLGKVAEVRFGIKTGANEFFYLEPLPYRPICPMCGVVHEEALTKDEEITYLSEGKPIPSDKLIAVRNGAGWEGYIEAEFLKPVIKSPREVKTIKIRPQDLKYRIFMFHKEKHEIEGTHALDYIEWGESAVFVCKKRGCRYRGEEPYCPKHGDLYIDLDPFPERPTCKSRPRWWSIPLEKGNTFWGKELRERLAVFVSLNKILADCRLYIAETSLSLQAILNSTLTLFLDEASARQYGGGGGPRSMMVYEVQNLHLINPNSFPEQNSKFVRAFNLMAEREIKSVFEELGLPKPNRDLSNINPEDVSLDKVMPDRRELDKVIFEVLDLTESEQLEVYKAVVELVKSRLAKARSV